MKRLLTSKSLAIPEDIAVSTVSIIIPCYRAQATICETIRSLLAQTHDDWECILVSDDGTSYLEYLATRGITDARIREHPVKTNRTGTVQPRNRGLPMAKGKFIADLDADDWWAAERLELLLPHAEEAGFVQDVLELFNDDGVIGHSGPTDGSISHLGPVEILQFDVPFHTIVRRELLGDEWFWHDSFIPDVLRSMWLANKTPLKWVCEPMLKYRVSTSSMSQSIEGAQRIDADYTRVLGEIETGCFEFMSPQNIAGCVAGFERKRDLNQRYIQMASAKTNPPPFLEWVVAG